MWNKLTNSWSLVKASGQVLAADKELLLFPLLSGAALVLVSVSFFVPLVIFGANISSAAEGAVGIAGYLLLFLYYFAQYFVIIFFNSALVGAAMIRLEGGNPTISDGLRIAWSRLGTILGYTAIAATVGLLLKALRERSGFLGRLAVGIVGMGWNLATFLVIPVLVTRQVGPIAAVKESAATLKRTWGEQIAGNVGIGFVFGVAYVGLGLLAVPMIILAGMTGEALVVVPVLVVIAALFLFTGLVHSAMSGIYSAAVYRYATTGDSGGMFGRDTLQSAFAS